MRNNWVSARAISCLVGLGLLLQAARTVGAEPPLYNPALLQSLTARSIGPSNMGGRIVAVAPVELDPKTMYVATASSGLWKTVNNGTTWTAVFENEKTVSLGDVAVAPSNPDIVW